MERGVELIFVVMLLGIKNATQRLIHVELCGDTGRSSVGRCFAANRDARVDSDHLSEDVKDGLSHVSKTWRVGYQVAYLGHGLVIDVDQFARVRVDLQCTVEAKRCLY